MFRRISQAHPLDYYWFWTPEGWTWEGTKDDQVRRTMADLEAALAAHRKIRPPFQLATCGWVLGPAQNRALFDQTLPKEVAVSCINREVGKTPVEPGFKEIQGRGKWAIPWLEDDPALTSPQLWAGRMRRDAADALDYGCDGLMGIHWRTRVLGPAVSALAQAAWDQSSWREELARRRQAPAAPAAIVQGGRAAAFPDHAIADTDEDAVYRTVRYDVSLYRLAVANGPCRVVLRFCEPHYREAGKRVFDVALNGRKVVESLDIFARVGADRALDLAFDGVVVTNGTLEIAFTPRTEFPSIAGLSVEGTGGAVHLDCGGLGAGRFLADLPEAPSARDVFAPVDDFYRDWAQAEFGAEVADDAAAIFTRIDGHLPRPSDWVNGPGGLYPDPRPWPEVAKEYAFVDELAALQARVRGPGPSARLDWWIATFRYQRSMGELNCRWAEFNQALAHATNAPAPDTAARNRVLELRRQLVTVTGEIYRQLLATLSNPGELGTLANWEQHIQPAVFGAADAALARLLGGPLPDDARLPTEYRGPTRVIVPTRRTSLGAEESLAVKALVLAEKPIREINAFSRPLGGRRFSRSPLACIGRGVHAGQLLPPRPDDLGLEYYVEAIDADGTIVRWPETAPQTGQTLVVEPGW